MFYDKEINSKAISSYEAHIARIQGLFNNEPNKDFSQDVTDVLSEVSQHIATHAKVIFQWFNEHLRFLIRTTNAYNFRVRYELFIQMTKKLSTYYQYVDALPISAPEENISDSNLAPYTIIDSADVKKEEEMIHTLYFFAKATLNDYLQQLITAINHKNYAEYVELLISLLRNLTGIANELNVFNSKEQINQQITGVLALGLRSLSSSDFNIIHQAHLKGPVAQFMRFPTLYEASNKGQEKFNSATNEVMMSLRSPYKGEFGIYQQENQALLKLLNHMEDARTTIAKERKLKMPATGKIIDSQYQLPENKPGRSLFEQQLQRAHDTVVTERQAINSPERFNFRPPLDKNIIAYSPKSFYEFILKFIQTALNQYGAEKKAQNNPMLALSIFNRYLDRARVDNSVESIAPLNHYLNSDLFDIAQEQFTTVATLYFPGTNPDTRELLKKAANTLKEKLVDNDRNQFHQTRNRPSPSHSIKQFYHLHQQKIEVNSSHWKTRGISRFQWLGAIRKFFTGSATWIPETISLAQHALDVLPNKLCKAGEKPELKLRQKPKAKPDNHSSSSLVYIGSPPTSYDNLTKLAGTENQHGPLSTIPFSAQHNGDGDDITRAITDDDSDSPPIMRQRSDSNESYEVIDNDIEEQKHPRELHQTISRDLEIIYQEGVKPCGSRSTIFCGISLPRAGFFSNRLDSTQKDYEQYLAGIKRLNIN